MPQLFTSSVGVYYFFVTLSAQLVEQNSIALQLSALQVEMSEQTRR